MSLVNFRYGEGSRVFFVLVHLIFVIFFFIYVLVDGLATMRHLSIGNEPILNELLVGRVFGGR